MATNVLDAVLSQYENSKKGASSTSGMSQEERLKNEIKMLKSYLNMLNEKIHSLCDHTFVSDCIDIDPDTSVKIYYCTVCKVSDLNDKIRMIQEKCCGREKCCDTDDY